MTGVGFILSVLVLIKFQKIKRGVPIVRLLICAGGTGGGVYPALAVLQALADKLDDILWVGGQGGMEAELIRRESIPYAEIPAAGVHGVGLRTLPGNILKLIKGFFASRKIIREFKPDVLLFTGGYVAAPMAVAGLRKKSLLYVPDIEPGLALKFLSRFADKIAVSAPLSLNYFKKTNKLVVTGYPTRAELKSWDKNKALDVLKTHHEKPILLCFGGSKGARSLNRALLAILPDLLPQIQIVHITGSLDWEEVQRAKQNLSAENQADYHIYPYLHEEMGAALSAADLVISRAGASAIGEFPLFGLPAILVPYPYAWRYQKVNAEYMVSHGAAILLRDENLQNELKQQVLSLINQPVLLQTMKQAMSALAHPQAATEIANLVLSLGNHPHMKGDVHD